MLCTTALLVSTCHFLHESLVCLAVFLFAKPLLFPNSNAGHARFVCLDLSSLTRKLYLSPYVMLDTKALLVSSYHACSGRVCLSPSVILDTTAFLYFSWHSFRDRFAFFSCHACRDSFSFLQLTFLTFFPWQHCFLQLPCLLRQLCFLQLTFFARQLYFTSTIMLHMTARHALRSHASLTQQAGLHQYKLCLTLLGQFDFSLPAVTADTTTHRPDLHGLPQLWRMAC